MPKRKPTRLPEYDYSEYGMYFLTICAKDMEQIFGRIVGEGLASPGHSGSKFQPSPLGKITEKHLLDIPNHYDNVFVDKYVIMPNHIHLIVMLEHSSGRTSPSPTIGNIIGGFKSGVSHEYGQLIWQRSYYDHIIRNEKDYERIWEYIENNPFQWEVDKFYNE